MSDGTLDKTTGKRADHGIVIAHRMTASRARAGPPTPPTTPTWRRPAPPPSARAGRSKSPPITPTARRPSSPRVWTAAKVAGLMPTTGAPRRNGMRRGRTGASVSTEIAILEYRGARKRTLQRIIDPNARNDPREEAEEARCLHPLARSIQAGHEERGREPFQGHADVIALRDLCSPTEAAADRDRVSSDAGRRQDQGCHGIDHVRSVREQDTRHTLGIVRLAGGTASLTASALPVGKHILAANYAPESKDIVGSSDSIDHEVT